MPGAAPAPAAAIRRASGLSWVEMQSKDAKASSEKTDPWGTVIRRFPQRLGGYQIRGKA